MGLEITAYCYEDFFLNPRRVSELGIKSTASTEHQPSHLQTVYFPQSPATQTTAKMVHRDTHSRVRLSPVLMATNVLIWISAVIVMGILSYLISLSGEAGRRVIYMEVISVLTVVFFLAAFFLASIAGFFLLFNLIFSYLWLVAVVFTAESYSNSNSNLLLTVEAFSFIAFFLLFFNVLYDWNYGYRMRRSTAVV
jgi:hypothetical protein